MAQRGYLREILVVGRGLFGMQQVVCSANFLPNGNPGLTPASKPRSLGPHGHHRPATLTLVGFHNIPLTTACHGIRWDQENSNSAIHSYRPALRLVAHVERTQILHQAAPAELNRGNPMLQPGLATLILMIFVAMLVTAFWRQVLVLLLSVVLTIFCFGLYYLAMLLKR